MRGTIGCMKRTVVVLNAAYLILGFALVGLGAWALSDKSLPHVAELTVFPIALVCFGSFLVVFTVLGVCGASRESRTLLQVYFVILFLIVAGEVSIGVASLKYRSNLESLMQKGWEDSPHTFVQSFQDKEQCCGFDGPSEAKKTKIPCPTCAGTSKNGTCPPNGKPWEGCKDAVLEEAESKMMVLLIMGLCVVFCQTIGLIFTCCLICHIPTEAKKEEMLLAEAQKLLRDGWDGPASRTYGTGT